MPFLKKDYTFKGFERSKNPKKKYDALLEKKSTKRIKRLSFGSRGMSQYKDSTPLKLYKSKDTNDKVRRKAFRDRFSGTKSKQNWNTTYTPLMFSWRYLW
jgi:hypothetical protein